MASNINWFVIWVPSYQAERSSKSKSKSRSKFEITKIGEEEENNPGGGGSGGGLSGSGGSGSVSSVGGGGSVATVGAGDGGEGEGGGGGDTVDQEQNVDQEETEENSTESATAPLSTTEPQHKSDVEKSDDTSPLIEECETTEKPSEMTITSEAELFLKWESLEDIVKRVISERKITNLHTVSSTDHQQTQFSFSVPFDQVEDLLIDLQNNGLGQLENTSLSVFPSSKREALTSAMF